MKGNRDDGMPRTIDPGSEFPIHKADTMRMRRFSTGASVVYEEVQQCTNAQLPTADAAAVVYHYMTVMESREKGTLVLVTQGGQLHVTHNNNPSLRRASWWERLRHPNRFPRLNAVPR